MRITLFICLVTLANLSYAQPLGQRVDTTYKANFFDYFLSSGQKDFYLSPDGSRLLINTDLRYQMLNAYNGRLIAEGKHVAKLNAGIASFFGILKNRSFNREDAIEKARFDEGTEYLVLPEAKTILMLDWNLEQNIVKAIDLETGQEKWSTDRYRYSAGSKSQYVDLVLGLANAGRLQRETPRDIAVANVRLQGFGTQAFTSNVATPAAQGFFTEMSGTGMVLLRVEQRYVALDIETGAERWVYDQRKLNFGFSAMTENGGLLVVNFASSYFQANERLIIKLDPQTGKELWTAPHLSNFRAGRTYLMGDRLICDYYGAEVFDVTTGERILISIDERTIKTQNAMTSVFMSDGGGGRGTEAIASPSFVKGDRLYTSTFKLGKRVYANDGSSKAMIQQYDLRTGKLNWESDRLSVGTDLSYASDTHVFVRKGKAFGKSSLYVLDAQTGKLLGETPTIEGFIYREGAADVLTDAYLYRGGKKRIYAFSTDNWEEAQAYDTKASKVGKLQAAIPASDALMTIGDKGVVFFAGDGSTTNTVQTAPLQGSFWNDHYGFLLSTQSTRAIDLRSQQEVASLLLVPSEYTLFLFSEDGSRLAVIQDGQRLRMFENSVESRK